MTHTITNWQTQWPHAWLKFKLVISEGTTLFSARRTMWFSVIYHHCGPMSLDTVIGLSCIYSNDTTLFDEVSESVELSSTKCAQHIITWWIQDILNGIFTDVCLSTRTWRDTDRLQILTSQPETASEQKNDSSDTHKRVCQITQNSRHQGQEMSH